MQLKDRIPPQEAFFIFMCKTFVNNTNLPKSNLIKIFTIFEKIVTEGLFDFISHQTNKFSLCVIRDNILELMDKLDDYNISSSKRSFNDIMEKINELLENELSFIINFIFKNIIN